MREQINDALALSTAIGDTFKVPVSVNISNNSYLTLTLPSQAVEKMSEADQQAYALRVARFSYAHWAHPEQLRRVSVVFQNRTDYGPVNYTRNASGGSWDVSELK